VSFFEKRPSHPSRNQKMLQQIMAIVAFHFFIFPSGKQKMVYYLQLSRLLSLENHQKLIYKINSTKDTYREVDKKMYKP